jgi:RIO kinase 1
MSSEKFLDDKSLKKLDRKLELIIDRVGIDRKTEDEVFDKSTLKSLEKLISDRVIDLVEYPISTGKEGNVFLGVTPKKKFVAIKIYRTSTSTFKHISNYILGDPRFKSIHRSRRDLIFSWTQKEFKNLERLQKAGVRAPKPIVYLKNVLVMQYIGNKNKPAPQLKDVEIKDPKYIFDTLIDFIFKMYNDASIVHGDVSAFNVLMYRKRPYLIDLGQGVLIDHPKSHDFLKRDIYNVISYFNKFGIMADEKKIYKKITKKLW